MTTTPDETDVVWTAQMVAEFDVLMRPPLAEVYLHAKHRFSPALDDDDEPGCSIDHLTDRLLPEEGRRDLRQRWHLYYRASVIARMQHTVLVTLEYTCLECFLNQRLKIDLSDCPYMPLELCLDVESHRHL